MSLWERMCIIIFKLDKNTYIFKIRKNTEDITYVF